ncbi:MAG: hypothetical protein AVDCRST_MAG59-612, partial [uncultured Thermomicrobiales bacterium]
WRGAQSRERGRAPRQPASPSRSRRRRTSRQSGVVPFVV